MSLENFLFFCAALGIGPRASVLSGQRSTTELRPQIIKNIKRLPNKKPVVNGLFGIERLAAAAGPFGIRIVNLKSAAH